MLPYGLRLWRSVCVLLGCLSRVSGPVSVLVRV
jgi:hypothetical protein